MPRVIVLLGVMALAPILLGQTPPKKDICFPHGGGWRCSAEFTEKDMIKLVGKPQSVDSGKCSGSNPTCPLGADEQLMHYPVGIVRLTGGRVYSIEEYSTEYQTFLNGAPIKKHPKRDRFLEIMTAFNAAAGVVADQITAVKACREVRKIPAVLLNTNQLWLLNACAAAGY